MAVKKKSSKKTAKKQPSRPKSAKTSPKKGTAAKTPATAKAHPSVSEEEQEIGAMVPVPEWLPVLPAKDMVPFPSVMMSLYLSRPSSIRAMEEAMNGDRLAFVVSQKNQEVEDATGRDLYKVGVIAHIVRALAVPDGRYKVLMQGIARAKASRFDETRRYLRGKIEPLESAPIKKLSAQNQALVNRIRENLQVLVEYEHLPEEMLIVTEEVQDPAILTDVILAHYKLEMPYAQAALEELDPIKRLQMTDTAITDDLNKFILTERIKDKAQVEMSKGQREYYLREQIKQIQRELGDSDISSEDLQGLKVKLAALKLPPLAREEAMKQLKRLERMSSESSEFALLRTYLEWVADLPWGTQTRDKLDLQRAKSVLDEDHFGLDKVKDRILEYLSVRALNPESKGPILCFVGPPGVGKTSLGKSVANALGRKFVRMSVGGIRDEAEIRGHRRTYVGALPGRIIQGLKQAGSNNPVFVLDELDKVGADFRGDPASALLEVLDPHQNVDFNDHYLNVPFDLSNVLFLATANTMDTIPEALVDRLEVLYIPGYTAHEKLKIASRYIVPRQIAEAGLVEKKIEFTKEALELVIDRYTREAGVRNLEREIGALCRKIAREVAEKKRIDRKLTPERVTQLLGPTKYDPEITEQREAEGLVRGLAWTMHGGEVMPVEVSVAKGSGGLTLTGQLGSVMQESAQAALFYARANANVLGLESDFNNKYDIHIHVPSGATPKDGPSAGITIATALVSALAKRKASKEIAMTGEMTLRGNVLAVGGLREKALAALQYGITKVIIPFENIKDLEEIPEEQRKQIQFIPVKHVSEVFELALLRPTKKVSKAKRTTARSTAASKKVTRKGGRGSKARRREASI